MPFYVFAWLGALFYGLTNVTGKLVSKYAIKNAWLFTILFAFFSLLFTIPFAVYNHVGMPVAWGNLSLSALFNCGYLVFYILAICTLDISVMSPLFNFRTAMGAILGFLILGESLSALNIVLVAIIFIAGFFVSLDEKFSLKSFFRLPILYGVLMAFSLAMTSIFINKSIADTGYWETNLFNPLISFVALLLTVPLFYKDIKTLNLKQIGGTAAMAFFIAIGNIVANRAFSENVSLSTAITSLPVSMFIVFILALFAPSLLEKHSLKVYAMRFGAAFIMIAAALKISGVW